MAKTINLIDKRFGKLVVIKRDLSKKGVYWKCQCDCGGTVSVRSDHLRSGATQSCGCIVRSPKKDIVGRKFGRYTVLESCGTKGADGYEYLCQCECGVIKKVSGHALRTGRIVSCGCWKVEATRKACTKHGQAIMRNGRRVSHLYTIWDGMRQRCKNPNHSAYQWYGGKGISVFAEWEDFVVFQEWALANGYKDELTIDRINPWKNYEPSNCRWIPSSQQPFTKRTSFISESEAEDLRLKLKGEER